MQIGLDSIIHTNASKKRKHNKKDNTSCSPKKCCHTTVLCIFFGWWNWRSTLFTPKLMLAIYKPDPQNLCSQHAIFEKNFEIFGLTHGPICLLPPVGRNLPLQTTQPSPLPGPSHRKCRHWRKFRAMKEEPAMIFRAKNVGKFGNLW